MQALKVFVDYDTTLVDFINPWLMWVNKRYQTSLTSHDITRWYYLREELGDEADAFWKSDAYNWYCNKEIVLPFEGAVEFFKTLQNAYGPKNVYIISSTREHHKLAKKEHIQYYFPLPKENCLLVGKEKYLYTSHGILVDDYPLHVMEHIKYNQTKGIVFNFQNSFGWAKEENYSTDFTLESCLPLCRSDQFSIHTNYNSIFKELCHG